MLVEVIKLKPDFYEAWVVRGNILHSMDHHFEALLHYDRALSINDNIHDAWNNRGLAFADIGMFAEAQASFRKSLDILPAIEPHMGLANMYCSIMKLPEAAAEYQAVVDMDPGCFDARFNLGVTKLGLGEWKQGFSEYEWRWKNTPYPPRPYRYYKKWAGEDLVGKRIILYPEQGYGDEIMGLRFAEFIARKFNDAYVIVLSRSPMLKLANNIQRMGFSAIVTASMHDDVALKADYSCPLLDVPMVLGLGPNDVSCDRYLRAYDDPRYEMYDWYDRLQKLPKGLNVGLCWASGTHLDTARAAHLAKSVKLEWLRPLIMPGINLISLQKPKQAVPSDFPMIDWMDECHDFNDTAALVEELDVVISVDTAVAHLAGALGKETYNLVRYSGYWPWLAPAVAPSPTKAIWYPSMTLLRQPSLHNWQQPIDDLIKIMKAKVS